MMPETPALLREQLVSRYGAEIAAEIERGFVRRKTTFRVNPLKGDRTQVLAQIAIAGLTAEPVAWYPDAFVLSQGCETDIQALPCYADGAVYLQSLSSMMPALVLDPKPGESILDMAAAPGGKTTQMAALSGGQALITACEKNPIRAERLQFNLTRQGAGRVSVLKQDARQLDSMLRFDKILLDAPCSGSGTICLAEGEPQRRMTADWLRKIAKTQQSMLKKALALLSKNHEMVYSTCSILRIENEDVVMSAVRAGLCDVVPIAHEFLSDVPQLPVSVPDVVCVRPTERFEGFFVAKLRKK